MKQLILIVILLLAWQTKCQTQNQTAISCSNIDGSSFNANLANLWGMITLPDIDKFAFLTICPILLIMELITLKFYHSYPKILGKAGVLFCIIIIYEMVTILHFVAAGIYFSIYSPTGPMPGSFPVYCEINSIISSFFSILHFSFVIIVPLYVIYVLRWTLKAGAKMWKFVYLIIVIVTSISTFFLWQQGFLGLNIYGLCGVTFIRQPDTSVALPVIIIVFNLLFLVAGIFTINYFKKHMPNSIGLREKRQIQKQTLMLYVIGYSAFWILESVIEILLYFNCNSSSPTADFDPLTTIYNIIRILQCFFIFVIIFKDGKVRKTFIKFVRKICSKKVDESAFTKYPSFSFNIDSDSSRRGSFNFEQVLLKIKEDSNEIDILKISQVMTLVSGVYLAYKQYYNLREEFHTICMIQLKGNKPELSHHSQEHRQNAYFLATKKIYFNEKMTIKINSEVIKDFINDLSLIPKLGILACTMTIHAPKIFQVLLQIDDLKQVFSSFELHSNTRKMFDLAEGQGGKSGQFFFFSSDYKYVLKTITQDEFEFIDENLFYFYEHFTRNPDSILAKIYGLFTFKGDEIQRTYHLILMKNILGCTNDQIIRTYDMKGSRHDRQVNVGDTFSAELERITLKDIDFMKEEGKIHIKNKHKVKLRQIIMRDTLFLKNLNLIDYSLLVVRVNWSIPPRDQHFWGQYMRIPSKLNQDEFYHIGIIDYLQTWDLQKKGEQWWKKIIGKKDISAQEPKKYQQRYMNFINQITQIQESTLLIKDDAHNDINQRLSIIKKPTFIDRLKKAQSTDRESLLTKIRALNMQQHEGLESFEESKAKIQVELSLRDNLITEEKEESLSGSRKGSLLLKNPFTTTPVLPDKQDK